MNHFAIIGIGIIEDNYPLYYDAVNEYGLCAAGLHFPGNAHYRDCSENAVNIASFELIPWLLSHFKSVKELQQQLAHINIVNTPFSEKYPPSPLHWLVSDAHHSIVIEATKDGMQIYPNHIGVLTNNPTFDFHQANLSQYLNLTVKEPENSFSDETDLIPFSRGLGSIGLPGDVSSASRFVRAAFLKSNSVCPEDSIECVTQFFHILSGVEQVMGCVRIDALLEKTVYSSCCNATRGIYYFKTYENSQISAVSLHHEQLNGDKMTAYSLIWQQQINTIN
jgi:choloylglycine hydrolase